VKQRKGNFGESYLEGADVETADTDVKELGDYVERTQ